MIYLRIEIDSRLLEIGMDSSLQTFRINRQALFPRVVGALPHGDEEEYVSECLCLVDRMSPSPFPFYFFTASSSLSSSFFV